MIRKTWMIFCLSATLLHEETSCNTWTCYDLVIGNGNSIIC